MPARPPPDSARTGRGRAMRAGRIGGGRLGDGPRIGCGSCIAEIMKRHPFRPEATPISALTYTGRFFSSRLFWV